MIGKGFWSRDLGGERLPIVAGMVLKMMMVVLWLARARTTYHFNRSTHDRVAARTLIRQGNGSIFFRHTRKTGGSSMRTALEAVAGELQRTANTTQAMTMVELEWGVFPVACLRLSPRALFVTVVRAPLERIHSDFWYSAVPRPLADAKERLQQYLEWIAVSNKTKGTVVRGIYVDNLQVRLLAGRCAVEAACVRRRDASKPSKIPASPGSFWNAEVVGGRGAWGGGLFRVLHVLREWS